MTVVLKVMVKYSENLFYRSHILKTYLQLITQIPLSFFCPRMFILGTIIPLGVYITAKILDHCYNHGGKGQSQLRFKSVFHLLRHIPLSFLLGEFIVGRIIAYSE